MLAQFGIDAPRRDAARNKGVNEAVRVPLEMRRYRRRRLPGMELPVLVSETIQIVGYSAWVSRFKLSSRLPPTKFSENREISRIMHSGLVVEN